MCWADRGGGGGGTLKVGSSLVKRLRALLKLPVDSRVLGMTASDITGSGTVMGIIEYLHQIGRVGTAKYGL